MSDLSLDAELLCRLKALDRINFRSDAKAHPNYFMSKLNLITFWKTGFHKNIFFNIYKYLFFGTSDRLWCYLSRRFELHHWSTVLESNCRMLLRQ